MTRILCALIFLLGTPWIARADAPKPLTAVLLVARAELPDPNFRGSIVLVTNNVGPAPGGVILNRPTRIPVSHLFPDLPQLALLPDRLYFGGPVQFPSVWFLVRSESPPEQAVSITGDVYLCADRALLLRLLAREKPMEGLRIFVGYSGWAPGQLEAEIARGDWTLEPVGAERIFERGSERPWPERESADSGQRT
jgi:putative transcriptional regulator